MAIQSLTPPQDITWKRMAFSRDMIDTNFGDMAFPPKWRSSLTVYYYIVPEEEVADAYPGSRVIYLKLSCSITGWNPSEDLVEIKQEAAATDQLDDLQKSIWEAVEASGWASKYWGCHGAIMQIGIFPSKADQVGPDDYPYIMDFEPKKRELFEAITEGSEALSATSDKLSVTKGSTHTFGVEIKPTFSIGPVGFGGSGVNYGYQHVDNNTTDTSRENRETKSYSSTFSQMYQLFNGYHLGTNRAVFVVSPRPHTVTGSFNLIDGERKLEGLQDIFLVVSMPRTLKGFCIHASIDTGHKNPEDQEMDGSARKTFALRTVDFSDPPCMGGTLDPGFPTGGGGGGGGGGSTGGGNDTSTGFSFVVTRRMVQSCGLFDENGNLVLQKVNDGPVKPPRFVGDVFFPVKNLAVATMARTNNMDSPEGGFDDCRETTAMRYNHNLSRMAKSMVGLFSSGPATPKPFKDTGTFRTLFINAAKRLDLTTETLYKAKYISDKEYEMLKRYKIIKLQDLFHSSAENIVDLNLSEIRNRIIKKGK